MLGDDGCLIHIEVLVLVALSCVVYDLFFISCWIHI